MVCYNNPSKSVPMLNIHHEVAVFWWYLLRVPKEVTSYPKKFSFLGKGDSSGPSSIVFRPNGCGKTLHLFPYSLVCISHWWMNVLVSLLRGHCLWCKAQCLICLFILTHTVISNKPAQQHWDLRFIFNLKKEKRKGSRKRKWDS